MKDEKMIREEDLKGRTRRYALGMIRLYAGLPKTVEAQVIGKQFIRSGPQLVHNIEKHAVRNLTPISSARLKAAYKN
jgi:hypothetical protein